MALLVIIGCGVDRAVGDGGAEGEAEAEAEAEAEGELPQDCPDPPPSIESCFRGAAFADCVADSGAATLGCGPLGCFWFAGGCLAEGYEVGCTPETPPCDGDDEYRCWGFAYQRGADPWDRLREMTLGVDVDPGLQVAQTTVDCLTCSAACSSGDNICAYPDDDVATAGLRGTLIVNLDPWGGYLWGWLAEIEVDLQAPAARFCRIPLTDAICSGPDGDPPCAVSGSLVLSGVPSGESDLVGTSGVVDATFDDSLEIHAEFVIE